MSPSTPTPHVAKERHPYGLEPKETATNERARPVPYLAGTRKLGLTWLGPAYNQRVEEVSEEQGGGGGKGTPEATDQVVGHNYFADVAGLLCLGAVDQLLEVWMDDEQVWRGNVRRAGAAHSATVTIEERGNLRIYWGTETQPVDSILAAFNHPAYRGQCYVVCEQLFFGQDKTQAPNVTLVVARGPAVPISGPRWIGADANPAHVAAEWMLNKRWGLGMPESALDLAQLGTAATAIGVDGIGISPLLAEQTSIREALKRLCEYVDAFPRFKGDKFQLVLNRQPLANSRVYPLVGEYDLTEPAVWGSEPWVETVSQVEVTFTDASARYEADSEPWTSQATEAIVGEPVKVTLDRPWATKRTTAWKLGAYFGRLNSVPLLSGRMTLRRNLIDDELVRRGDEIQAGGLVRFTTAAFARTLLLRVVKKTVNDDRSQAVELEVETDRYYAAVLAYVPDDVPGPDDRDRGPGPLLAGRVVEVPRNLAKDDPGVEDLSRPQFTVLAARRRRNDVRVKVLASDDGATFRRFGVSRHFCSYGTLVAALPRGRRINPAAEILVNIPVEAIDRNWPTVGEKGWWRGNFLAVIGREFLSVREIEVVSATQIKLKGIIRGRFGIYFEDHPASADVFLSRRSALMASTQPWIQADELIEWKLLCGTKFAFQPAADVTAFEASVVNTTARPIGPCNLRINGAKAAPFEYAGGGNIVVKWTSRHWMRHKLWQSFDDPYQPLKLEHRVYFFTAGGVEVFFSKVKDAARVQLFDGEFQFTMSNAALVAAYGSEPDELIVRVFEKQRGLLSIDFVEARVRKTGAGGTSAGSGALCYAPSGLKRLWATTNPEALIQDNFDLIVAHWPAIVFPHPTVTGSHARQARNRVKANFTAIATERSLTLHDVQGPGAAHPALVAEANFEAINEAWLIP